jgi:hypothetical protein
VFDAACYESPGASSPKLFLSKIEKFRGQSGTNSKEKYD